MRALSVLIVGLLLSACAASGTSPSVQARRARLHHRRRRSSVTLRLGYFPNVTHATAIVGINKGFFDAALGDNVTLQTQYFNAGTDAVEALFSGALDATYIGPNPAINAFAKSDGQAIRIIAGAASGGAALVVKPEITSTGHLAARPCHAVARQHPGRRAAGVAEGPGLHDRCRGRRRRLRQAAGQRRRAAGVHPRPDRRRLGARAVGDPHGHGGRRPRCSSTSATSGPTASSSRPTWSWPPPSWRRIPTSSSSCSPVTWPRTSS